MNDTALFIQYILYILGHGGKQPELGPSTRNLSVDQCWFKPAEIFQ
jgi:hypothetical protein